MKKLLLFIVFFPLIVFSQSTDKSEIYLNTKEREAWFTELGFGMFIHWSVDVQYGYNISHNLRLASGDFITRYFTELPKTFNPVEFNPTKWAKMAKMSGMKYVVFTAKHHNGFCMWNTKTTNFNIMKTPFGRDILKEVIEAFRKENIAIGIYFSPDDFFFLHKQGIPITREHPSSFAKNNAALDAYDKRQLRELLTKYGTIDILFLDGNDNYGKSELAKLAWEMDKNIVVTRGAMATPEQKLPNEPLPSPWEACYTLSESWSYRPTNEVYKSASEVILKWVDIKAKGGNLLLNVSPDAEGAVSKEQSGVLNEVGAWWFINSELFKQTKPFLRVKSDSGYYFLQSQDENHLYIVIPGKIERNVWQSVFIENLTVAENAKISVLGNSAITDEKEPENYKPMSITNTKNGINIQYIFKQRIYNSYLVENRWENPVVVKVENFRVVR